MPIGKFVILNLWSLRLFFETEKRLLRKAKSLMPSLPFDQLDALIVEEFGKEISGAGLDPHISGRTDIRGVDNPSTPFIHKIAALRMTAATNRNGMGTGMVDFLPQPTANKLDLHSMYMNAVSSTVLEKAFLPIVLANDQEVIRALVTTCWQPEINSIRLAQIRSTLHLNEMLLTTPLFEEAQSKGSIASFDETDRIFQIRLIRPTPDKSSVLTIHHSSLGSYEQTKHFDHHYRSASR